MPTNKTTQWRESLKEILSRQFTKEEVESFVVSTLELLEKEVKIKKKVTRPSKLVGKMKGKYGDILDDDVVKQFALDQRRRNITYNQALYDVLAIIRQHKEG